MVARSRAGCFFLLLVAACSGRPEFTPGEECELNSQCDSRLVCRLGRCRIECRAQRDCGAGLQCVRDEGGLGACQLEEETRCTTNSSCPEPLICQFGRCTNMCNDDVDCPPGAACLDDGSGTLACVDMAERECQLNSDCVDLLLICAVDHRCREQCRTDRDCRDGLECRDDLHPVRVCASPDARPDAGMDAGPPVPDGGDAGRSDAGGDVVPTWAILAAGLDHTCGTRPSGTTACWGGNTAYQVGDGTTTDATSAAMLGIAPARAVGAGAAHSCIATPTEVFCWGDNGAGQVGVGGDPVMTPTPVTGVPSPVTDLALGSAHTCAIAAGRVFCWGANSEGQLGFGDVMPRPTPTEVPLAGTPAQVSAFSQTTCVRFMSGAVSCFGDGALGQIGDGAGVDRRSPTPVTGLTDAVQIGAGTSFACALRATGQVVCWGDDFFGQIGDGPPTARRLAPVATGPIAGALSIAVGSGHACARTATGVSCWGDNAFGQCGADPSLGAMFRSFDVPTAVAGLGAVDAIGVGTTHTCARTGPDFVCFGANSRGQLGNGATGVREHTPQSVVWP